MQLFIHTILVINSSISFCMKTGGLKSTFLIDRVIAGGGCEAAATVRTRCGWVMLGDHGRLVYGKRFPLKLKGAVY